MQKERKQNVERNHLGTYDVIVIGAGHAGIEAAVASAKLGAKTALFTMTLDGGTDASGDAVYDFGMRLTSEQLGDLGLSFRISDVAG